MLIIGETTWERGAGDTWEASLPSAQFFCTLKTVLKYEVYYLKRQCGLEHLPSLRTHKKEDSQKTFPLKKKQAEMSCRP